MSIIKLALENKTGISPIVENDQDPRLLPTTIRQKPQYTKIKPNKTVLNWGMKN